MTAHRDKISVPVTVHEIPMRNYAVYQCLKMKLVNFHSLSELIQPEVLQLSEKEASVNTLIVAIKRYPDTLPHICA